MYEPRRTDGLDQERKDAVASVASVAGVGAWENEGGAAAHPQVDASLIARWMARIAKLQPRKTPRSPVPEQTLPEVSHRPDSAW
jgi:hypothetical protein